MKTSCLQENLNKGLTILNRIISSKTQLPILGNILLATDQNRLRLSATNLETSINFWLGAKNDQEGKITVPAKTLAELIASFPAEKVSLEGKADVLKISCGAHKASLNGLSANEFPPFFISKQKPEFSFPRELFLQAILRTAFAAAQDEGRPVLTGIKWSQDKEGLFLAATDGYRLSLQRTPLVVGKWEKDLIIPARALLETAHIAQEKEGEGKEGVKIFLAKEENQISFSFDNVEIMTRLIEGEFPDFSKIIPQSFATRVVLDREALLGAMRIAAIFARGSANIVKWKIGKGKITFLANTPQVGEESSELEAKTEGEEGEIAFNFRYLLDFLNVIKSEEVVFEMSGPLNPGVFKPVGDDSLLHIIMPVRVQG